MNEIDEPIRVIKINQEEIDEVKTLSAMVKYKYPFVELEVGEGFHVTFAQRLGALNAAKKLMKENGSLKFAYGYLKGNKKPIFIRVQ